MKKITKQKVDKKITISGDYYGDLFQAEKNTGIFFSVFENDGNNFSYGCYYSCREEFHEDFNAKSAGEYFLFSHGANFRQMKSLVLKVERILKLSSTSQIKLIPVTKNYCLIKVSRWWKNNDARLQFLTILLRAGLKNKNFARTNAEVQKVLFLQKYFKQTQKAVLFFLKGGTKIKSLYMKKQTGWEKWDQWDYNTEFYFYGWVEVFRYGEKNPEVVLEKPRIYPHNLIPSKKFLTNR